MPDTASRPFGRMGAWLPLWAIVVVTIVASVNRQLVGLIAQPVKVEFGLTDTQLGAIASFAGLIVAVAAPFLGQLTDRRDRYRLLFVAILVWSAATAGYGLAIGYAGLVIGLSVLATAESTMAPIANSLIGDRFRDQKRVDANLIYFAAGGLTAGIGSFVAGTILRSAESGLLHATEFGATMTPWRIAMVVIALVGIPLAALVLLLGKDQRTTAHTRISDLSDIADYWQSHWKTLVSFNIANAGYFVAATSIMGWMPIYMIRHYGIAPSDLGTRMGIVIGIADLSGIFVGIFAIRKLYRRLGPIAPRYIFQVSLLLIAMVAVAARGAPTAWAMLILLGCMNFLATFGTASFNNMIQDISAAHIRGKVVGVNTLLVTLASTPGPLAVGALSDHLKARSDGLLLAMLAISIPALLLSIVLYGVTNQSFLRTVRAMRESDLPPQSELPPVAA